jgi:hypothetical protein
MFDDKAKSRSLQLWLTTHRPLVAAAGAAAAAVAVGAVRLAR